MDDEEAITSELIWLAALNQEAGLPVPAPVPMPDGFCLKSLADDCDWMKVNRVIWRGFNHEGETPELLLIGRLPDFKVPIK